MSKENFEITNNVNVEEGNQAAEKAQRMLEEKWTPTKYQPAPDELTIALIERVPLLSGILKKFGDIAGSANNFATLKGQFNKPEIGTAAHAGGLALSSLEIILLPIKHLAARL